MDSNAKAKAENRTAINLKSVLIGNGLTDFATMIPSYYEMMCTPASVEPFVDIATCVALKAAVSFYVAYAVDIVLMECSDVIMCM